MRHDGAFRWPSATRLGPGKSSLAPRGALPSCRIRAPLAAAREPQSRPSKIRALRLLLFSPFASLQGAVRQALDWGSRAAPKGALRGAGLRPHNIPDAGASFAALGRVNMLRLPQCLRLRSDSFGLVGLRPTLRVGTPPLRCRPFFCPALLGLLSLSHSFTARLRLCLHPFDTPLLHPHCAPTSATRFLGHSLQGPDGGVSRGEGGRE